MKRIIFFILFFICTLTTFAQPNNFSLVWEDNFDSLNTNRWKIADYSDHYGELQLYLKQNVFTQNGTLCIQLQDTPVDCPEGVKSNNSGACGPCKTGIHEFSSGWIESKPQYATQFGYIESRIKLPYRYGIWPAFWTFEQTNKATNAAEIDIFEMLGYLPSNTITTNIHTEYPDKIQRYQQKKIRHFNYQDWHTYAILWNEKEIIWYIDEKKIRKVKNHNIVDPIRIIYNLAVSKGIHKPIDQNFTDTMYIDYIKIYKQTNTNGNTSR